MSDTTQDTKQVPAHLAPYHQMFTEQYGQSYATFTVCQDHEYRDCVALVIDQGL